jgi:hypothetical protein
MVTRACGRDEEQTPAEPTSPILVVIGCLILALLVAGAIWLIIRWNNEARERDRAWKETQDKLKLLNGHDWIARHSNPNPGEVPEPEPRVDWNGLSVTEREAEVIDAEMRAIGDARRQYEKAQAKERAEAKAKAQAKERRLSAERAHADALLFVHAYESLQGLLPSEQRRLDASDRDSLIAALTGTKSDVVKGLRTLRNRVAHKQSYSSKEIRAGKQTAENLIRNARLLRNARSAQAQQD